MHPKKSFFINNPQTQQPPAMPPSHSYTGFSDLSMAENDDIDIGDICPICDGDCTCNSSTPANNTPTPAPPIARPAAPAPLKIKLTVPAKLLKRPHAPSPSGAKHNDNPKRRGRPPKPRPVAAKAPPPAQNQNLKKSKPAPRARDTTGRRKPPPRRGSDDEYCPAGTAPSAPDADPTMPFPTFMSMSTLSSASSSSSSESETETFDFDGDSSIEGEEERFIVAEERQREHERARVRRELLGDPVFGSGPRRRTSNWEIRPRKASGDEMDVAMDADSEDADSDADDDDDDEETEAEDADEADAEVETPVRGEDTGEGEEDEETVTYAGIATSWSEDDEESSLDAELFFAGLTDSSDSDVPLPAGDGDDGDETVSEGEGDHRQGVAFEVTEGWDGTYIFTNGLGPGQGLLDFDFDANVDAAHAQLFLAAPNSSGSSSDSDGNGDVDVKMEMDEDFGAWETGYERDEDDGDSAAEIAMDSDDGATTDEELVDENGLPTERLMRLFRPLPLLPPFNSVPVSAIDPMSTMSPGSAEHRSQRRSSTDLQSPRPLDILEGRHAFWDPEYDDEESSADGVPVQDVAGLTLRGSSEEEEKRGSPSKKRKSGPRMGTFATSGSDALRRAVIDGSDGHLAEVPSPFPRRCARKRRRGEDDVGSGREMSCSRDRSLSLSAFSVAQSSNPLSPSPLAPSETPMSPSLELPPASDQPSSEPEPVLLSDVLDASLLDSDPFEPPSTDPSCLPLPSSSTGAPYDDESADDHGRHLQRWDRIPMGTFRRTREAGDDLVLDGMMRSSPFNGVLWSAKGAAAAPTEPASPTARKGKGKAKAAAAATKGGRRGSSARRDVIVSPVILPVRDRDGDRTPTVAEQLLSPPKGGRRSKESRRDKMMKRKSMMGVSPGGSGGKHHRHQHHPNAKGRALGGVQRGGGYGGAVPPLSL